MIAANGILLILLGLGVVLTKAQYQIREYTNNSYQGMDEGASDVYESPSMDPSMDPSMAPEVYESPTIDPSMTPTIEVYESPSMDPSTAPTIQEYSTSPTILNETSNVTNYNISDSTDASTSFPSVSPTASVNGSTKSIYHTMLTRKAFIIGAFALTVLGGSFVVVYFYELCRPNKMLQTSFQSSMNGDAEWSSIKNEVSNSVGDIESLEQTTDVTKLLARSDSIVFNITDADSAKYRTGHSRTNSNTALLSENFKFGNGTPNSSATTQAMTPNHSRKNSITNPMSLENDLIVPNPSTKRR